MGHLINLQFFDEKCELASIRSAFLTQIPWLETRTGFETLQRPAKLTDFEADKSLGKGRKVSPGAYGKVIKVKSRKSGVCYAMKVVAKKIIENSHMIDQLKNEVNIMSKLSHSRIIHLHTIFEDQKNIYFVLELAEEVVASDPGPSLFETTSRGTIR